MKKPNSDRGISTVVAALLLLAVIVVLSLIVGGLVYFGGGENSPQATVLADQAPDSDGDGAGNYQVSVQFKSADQADYIVIKSDNKNADIQGGTDIDGDGVAAEIDSVGGTIVVNDLRMNDNVQVVAVYDGRSRVIRTIRVVPK